MEGCSCSLFWKVIASVLVLFGVLGQDCPYDVPPDNGCEEDVSHGLRRMLGFGPDTDILDSSQYPFVVSLQTSISGSYHAGTGCYYHFCMGTMIAPNLILTTAYCLSMVKSPQPLEMMNGQLYYLPKEPIYAAISPKCRHLSNQKYGRMEVHQIFIHPEYDIEMNAPKNDVAILSVFRLDGKFYEGPLVEVVDETMADVQQALVLQYGTASPVEIGKYMVYPLHGAQLNLIEQGFCKDMFDIADPVNKVSSAQLNYSNMVCYYNGNASVCQGDAGGPLLDNIGIQVGMTSWGPRSCYGFDEQVFASVFVRLTQFSEWIQQIVQEFGVAIPPNITVAISPNSPPASSPPRTPPPPSPSPPSPVPSPLMPPVAQQGICNYQAYNFSTPGVCTENTAIQLQAAGGVVTDPPGYMISIQVPMKGIKYPNWGPCYKHECGGSLIAPNLVLTAGHCFAKYSGWINENGNINSQFEIYAARAPICRHETGFGRIGVIKVFMHPDYDMEVYNDVAILELLGAFDGPYINYQQAYKLMLKDRQELYLMGYGLQYAFDGGYKRLPFVQLTMTYMSDSICKYSLGADVSHAFVYENMLCAYPFKGSTCQGDSGSPLVLKTDDNEDVVVGINSWGNNGKCGQTKSTVYTEIGSPHITLWIDKIVQTYGTVHGSVQWTKPQPLTD